ncbi:hypothetical protein [Fimbriimonas ginsengisoli]|uniref:Phage-Barnase-EndoU-ColicinE5/D-RelE like nuclease 3 domain-containing protein n=1 Tax=Fimbriimonas ginsengisoli Gsoil 348 TaxID=661478 RepID=A0A068NU80_FIMGI|nr:hypothetical protein [Fimbriimonas ginsengisoli]AIE86996.1 hypothetical protein OP10G_3628 [Fimbriimonas ginsengisoli Gsoil 348]
MESAKTADPDSVQSINALIAGLNKQIESYTGKDNSARIRHAGDTIPRPSPSVPAGSATGTGLPGQLVDWGSALHQLGAIYADGNRDSQGKAPALRAVVRAKRGELQSKVDSYNARLPLGEVGVNEGAQGRQWQQAINAIDAHRNWWGSSAMIRHAGDRIPTPGPIPDPYVTGGESDGGHDASLTAFSLSLASMGGGGTPPLNPYFVAGVDPTSDSYQKSIHNIASDYRAGTQKILSAPRKAIHAASDAISMATGGQHIDPSIYENDAPWYTIEGASRASNKIAENLPYAAPGVGQALMLTQLMDQSAAFVSNPKAAAIELWHGANPFQSGIQWEDRLMRSAVIIGLLRRGKVMVDDFQIKAQLRGLGASADEAATTVNLARQGMAKGYGIDLKGELVGIAKQYGRPEVENLAKKMYSGSKSEYASTQTGLGKGVQSQQPTEAQQGASPTALIGVTRQSQFKSAAEFAIAVRDNPAMKDRLTVGNLSATSADLIWRSTGIRLKGPFAIRIYGDGIRHALNRHGNEIHGQMSIAPEDFNLIEDAINNPDRIQKDIESGPDGKPRIVFEKTNKGKIFVVTAIYEPRRANKAVGELRFVTMYKHKAERQ